MIELKVNDLVRETKGKLICGNPESKANNFTKDSRIVPQNRSFFSIKR